MKFLFNFNYKRGVWGAIGFYFVYVILFFILTLVVGYFVSQGKSVSEAQEAGMAAGRIMGIGFPTLIAFLVVFAKKLFKDPVTLVVALLTPVLAYFGAMIIGFLPVAFLTTRKPNTKK
jgi:hypothetical protein